MMVQGRAVPRSSKPSQIRNLPTLQPNRLFSGPKNLDFSTWASDNCCKITTNFVLIITIATVFFIYTSTNTTSLLCLQTQIKTSLNSISLPQINYKSIKPIADNTSPYANFRSEQWVIVSVSDYPSDALKNTVKIDNDLGKHFDVELVGEGDRQDVMLQYSHDNPNRTVVNPYIHFGQRSVWPRGLPLENVGEIGPEEFYTEVFGGKQFIQQGISDGLPDVDSVFYFTRKSNLEAFDIRFDERPPKMALPQGTMVPLNSFNTLYHCKKECLEEKIKKIMKG